MSNDVTETLRKANELQTEIKELQQFNRWVLGGDTSWRNGGGQYQVNCFLKKHTTSRFSLCGWLLHSYAINNDRQIRIPNAVLEAISKITLKYQSDLESQLNELLKGGKNDK